MTREARARLILCLPLVIAGVLCFGCGLKVTSRPATTQQAPAAAATEPAAAPATPQPVPAQPTQTEPPKYVYAGVDQPMIYHYRQDCPAMKGTALEIEMAAARAQNMTPCPTCVPQGQ